METKFQEGDVIAKYMPSEDTIVQRKIKYIKSKPEGSTTQYTYLFEDDIELSADFVDNRYILLSEFQKTNPEYFL